MTRITTSTFDSVIDEFRRDPFNVGFDNLFDRLVDFQTTVNPTQKMSYPHYNVAKVGENDFVIEIALAGFSEENLSVTAKENTLEVKGEIPEKDTETVIHRGISTRDFNRRWNLADSIEVTGADFKNGLLTVHLKNVIPEELKPRVISINTNSPAQKEFLAESK
jgi:molecular chaperone IbpA